MNENFKNMEYIELRLLMYIDCKEKYEKITDILSFLRTNNFLSHLTVLYAEGINSEDIKEVENVMSLSIDTLNDTLRFKFWDGNLTFWLFHTSDLFDSLMMQKGRTLELYDKYRPITELLFDFKKRWSTSIYHISYEYTDDGNDDIVYDIIFTSEVRETNFTNKILDKINKEIIMLGHDVTDGLKFRIKHSFKESCSVCEKARKEREENERNKNNG